MTSDSIEKEIKELPKALEILPQKQREVISMKIFQKMTFGKISRALRISQNTAWTEKRKPVMILFGSVRSD